MKRTPLTDLHEELGARIVDFAGWAMPVQFSGVMAEHAAVRSGAGLFDVSHMGQLSLSGEGVIGALEALMPQSLADLPVGRQRYGFLTNVAGGIIDDLMVARTGPDAVQLVVNAGNRDVVHAHLQAGLPEHKVPAFSGDGLVALQGPEAETVLTQVVGALPEMRFMDAARVETAFGALGLTRSGYTGEDGFEISVPAAQSEALCRALLGAGAVACGLGARDSLRLEAGLCLHGADIDATTTPVEAGLVWAIQKPRRSGGDYPGADIIGHQIAVGPERLRVGLRPQGRAPMRAGVPLFDADDVQVGQVTSGGFGPTVGAPVAMGYVSRARAEAGTVLWGEVRGKRLPVEVVSLPFVPPGFKR